MSISGVDDPDRGADPAQPGETRYDVFLSYSSNDRLMVGNVARQLRKLGLTVWFDLDSLPPGSSWQAELQTGLMSSRACAVFCGPNGLVGWERIEMALALDRAARDSNFRLFAVLLPGIEFFDASTLPPFLATRQWVDLREGAESAEAVQDLINAIHGTVSLAPTARGSDGGECPYRGLEAFGEEDARYFFGRTAQIQRLLEALRQSRFTAVVGQSGEGKSSLVRAGLLPRLRSGALPGSASWRIVVVRPGASPAVSLMSRIGALDGTGMQAAVEQFISDERTLHLAAIAVADEPIDARLLILIDQFEEIFTLCRDSAERSAFVRNIVYAATIPHGPTVVVATMRADFYSQIDRFPELAQLVQSRQMLVPRLRDAELRRIIEEPAHQVGLLVEAGLTETILADVERGPGYLPLLQHALLETWRQRRGGVMTLEGYRATGGVQNLLGERAETVYQELSKIGKIEAKSLFLRLIQPGEGTADTRRRVPISEIIADADSAATEVIHRFVDERL